MLKAEFGVNMTLGASNVSFGMPDRHSIAATFLPIAISAGLTSAIMDARSPQIVRAVKAADIVRAAKNVDKKVIVNVGVFDVYEGKGIEPDKKSIAIAVTLQPRDKTMTDAEIDALAAKIVAEVTKNTGGVLRV